MEFRLSKHSYSATPTIWFSGTFAIVGASAITYLGYQGGASRRGDTRTNSIEGKLEKLLEDVQDPGVKVQDTHLVRDSGKWISRYVCTRRKQKADEGVARQDLTIVGSLVVRIAVSFQARFKL